MLERNKRFLNYWLTITKVRYQSISLSSFKSKRGGAYNNFSYLKTTPLTSYTTTSSLGSIICTPYGQSFGPCAGN